MPSLTGAFVALLVVSLALSFGWVQIGARIAGLAVDRKSNHIVAALIAALVNLAGAGIVGLAGLVPAAISLAICLVLLSLSFSRDWLHLPHMRKRWRRIT